MDVDKFLQTYCLGQDGALWPRIAEQLRRGGKRLRPRLCLQTHWELGGKHPKITNVAASWELLHLGLLMHDDIMDGDYLRHGKPNIMGEYYLLTGDMVLARNMAILAGDLCITAAYDLQRQIGNRRLMDLLQSVTSDVIEGQRLDVTGHADPFETARLKTASYTYVGPMLSGAILAGANGDELARLRQVGERLGVAYQIDNDRNGIEHDQGLGRITTATVFRTKV